MFKKIPKYVWIVVPIFLVLIIISVLGYYLYLSEFIKASLAIRNAAVSTELVALRKKVDVLETEDQRQKNKALSELIAQIKAVYKKSVTVYESLVDLKLLIKNTAKQDDAYSAIVSLLAAENYATASSKLDTLAKDIVAAIPVVTAAPTNAGQTVKSDIGDYPVSYVTADLSNTKVIVDTASDGDCGNNCPVLPLATYVSRNGAFAGINGSYFCPAAYPSCAGKTNTFDLLVMNKNKKYFNSDNNVYSNNPGVIFGGGYIRFVSAVSQWGRDTGIDGMLSNYPLTLFNSNINFGGNDDPKQGSKGNRSFVGNKGNTIYIGVIFNVTVAEGAHVLKSMGLENALNLDSGGSTALWNGGYKVGPGRDIPNAILFVKK